MNPKQLTKNSKFLSLILRHKPQLIGLELDKNGWANVKILLKKMNEFGKNIDIEDLEYIVQNNNKKRFIFNNDKSKIRANQGHSIDIELDYKPQEPPEFLYHGTTSKFIDAIMKEGLKKMKRHHVHLSPDTETAEIVGARRGKPIILKINAQKMNEAGFDFFVSANNVWLTDNVPPEYIQFS